MVYDRFYIAKAQLQNFGRIEQGLLSRVMYRQLERHTMQRFLNFGLFIFPHVFKKFQNTFDISPTPIVRQLFFVLLEKIVLEKNL